MAGDAWQCQEGVLVDFVYQFSQSVYDIYLSILRHWLACGKLEYHITVYTLIAQCTFSHHNVHHISTKMHITKRSVWRVRYISRCPLLYIAT